MSPDLQSGIPVNLPSSLTITTKTKELQSETASRTTSPPQLNLLHQMLSDNPLMGAAMQQMMSTLPVSSSPSSPSLPGLPSSADLLQQAHALQLLAQLQSVLLVNRPDQAQVMFWVSQVVITNQITNTADIVSVNFLEYNLMLTN